MQRRLRTSVSRVSFGKRWETLKTRKSCSKFSLTPRKGRCPAAWERSSLDFLHPGELEAQGTGERHLSKAPQCPLFPITESNRLSCAQMSWPRVQPSAEGAFCKGSVLDPRGHGAEPAAPGKAPGHPGDGSRLARLPAFVFFPEQPSQAVVICLFQYRNQ